MRRFFTLVLLLVPNFPARAQDAPPLPPPRPLVAPTPLRPPLPSAIVVRAPQTPATPTPSPTTPTLQPSPTTLPLTAHEGVLIETADGKSILTQSADEGFNPASALKIATALVALRTLGADYRFTTGVYTNGQIDAATGTLNGDLYISSRDFSFHDEQALLLARELNSLGIRTINGSLVVTPGFVFDFSAAAPRNAERLAKTFDSMQRPSSAVRAWTAMQRTTSAPMAGQSPSLTLTAQVFSPMPNVKLNGATRVGTVPPNARLLFAQRSSPLTDILKVMLCYSNNFMAERLGDYLGGVSAVRSALVNNFGVNPYDLQMSSTSGLGYNRITPRAMLKIYRALVTELAKNRLEPSAILPVAGIDPGTLERRFNDFRSRGSVIAKTGTLPHTSGGASALVGEFKTQSGDVYYFVIFNRGHNVIRARRLQEQLITALQFARGGGPAPFAYTPQRLALYLPDEGDDASNDLNERN